MSDDDTVVFEPADRPEDDDAGSDPSTDAATGNVDPSPTTDAEFDWRGWVLVATVVFAFVVVPGALYGLPAARDVVVGLGLSLRDTYLVLPLLPAFLLGAVAVWSAVRSRANREE